MPNQNNEPPVKLPEWMTEKCILVVWIACFGVLIILSFFIFVPVAITMENAGNNCFLYSDESGFGELSVCSYCVASAVIFLSLCGFRLIVLVIKITRHSSHIFSERIYNLCSIWGVHLLIFILDALMLTLLLVTACLISVGLGKICDLFQDKVSCSSDIGVELPSGEVDNTFYKALKFSEGSAWFTFCFWLLVVATETFIGWKKGSFTELTSWISRRMHKESAADGSASSKKEEPSKDMTKY